MRLVNGHLGAFEIVQFKNVSVGASKPNTVTFSVTR